MSVVKVLEVESIQTQTEDYALARVPLDKRRGVFEMSIVRMGQLACLPLFMMGASLGFGLSFWDAFWAILLGTVLLEIVAALVGAAGAKEGLSTYTLARWAGFGRTGSAVIGLASAVSGIGWFGIQNAVFAQGITDATHHVLNFTVSTILGGALIVAIVVFGFRWIRWTANIAVPLFIVIVGYALFALIKGHSVSQLIASAPPGAAMSIGIGATIVTGAFMIGAVATPDMTRYMKRPRDVVWMTIISFTVGELLMGLTGVIMAHATGSQDPITIMLKLVGSLGGIIVVLSTIKINDWNIYAPSLAVSNFLDTIFHVRINRGWISLIIGVLGTILTLMGIFSVFVPFLMVLGVTLPPVAGVIVVDYYLLKTHRATLDQSRERMELPSETPGWSWTSIVSWIAASAIGYFVTWGIPSLTSLIVGGVFYFVLEGYRQRQRASLSTGDKLSG